MRVILNIPTEVAQGLLDYLTGSIAEPEVMVRVRLVHRRAEPQPPRIVWEVEVLPDNGGIYRKLLEGGNK